MRSSFQQSLWRIIIILLGQTRHHCSFPLRKENDLGFRSSFSSLKAKPKQTKTVLQDLSRDDLLLRQTTCSNDFHHKTVFAYSSICYFCFPVSGWPVCMAINCEVAWSSVQRESCVNDLGTGDYLTCSHLVLFLLKIILSHG